MKSILICGASGLIGKKLTQTLISKGYEVRILSRNESHSTFLWNPAENYIDKKAFENLDAIIHLAGAPVSKRWTKAYQKEIYDSRIQTSQLLFDYVQKLNIPLKTYITASGSNYYGTKTTATVFKETDLPSHDFLGQICIDAEATADKFKQFGTRVCAVRTSAVLSPDGGILEKLIPMANSYVLSPIGSGKQRLPWIHIQDMVNIYVHLLENEHLEGAYNAVADEKVNNEEFTRSLAKTLGKKVILPAVPRFFLQLILGKMAEILLEGSDISNQKIKDSGFQFQYPKLEPALQNLLA